MLWNEYLTNFEGEKVKVIFNKDYTYRVEELVFHFAKDSQYHLPLSLAKQLEEKEIVSYQRDNKKGTE